MTAVDGYLAKLPADRKAALARVRDVVNANLPAGYEEALQYGMIAWIVPSSRLAKTYNGQPLALACLGSAKNNMVLHLMNVYGDTKLRSWFETAYKATGKKLDMGKGCLRFKTLDALPLDVVGELMTKVSVDRYVEVYEESRKGTAAGKKAAAKKPAAKKRAKR